MESRQATVQLRQASKGLGVRFLTLMAVLIALGTVTGRMIYIPIGLTKVFPVQHAINVLGAVVLGPIPAGIVALVIGGLRNILGTGTIFAFPGGIIGAVLAGILFKLFKRDWAAVAGEVTGTGLIGALVSFYIARYFMGSSAGALAYVIPFALSSVAGAAIAFAILKSLRQAGALPKGD